MKLKVLALTTGSSFSEEEYKLYNGLIGRIHKMEDAIEGKSDG
jgi:hypothetical protein